MDFDLPRSIKHTRLLYSDALLPVLEAVINSIHAINESDLHRHGTIRIDIGRDQGQPSLPFDNATKGALQHIRSFTILDDGIGFTDVHFRSFCTADTQQKASLGGKGIGRFLWLKAFDHAEIESTYKASDNKVYKRRFFLRLTPTGVEDHTRVEASTNDVSGTI